MTTKEYLGQIRDARRRMNEKQAEINRLRDRLVNITVNLENEHVSSSSDPDKIGSMIATILDREAELKEYVDSCMKQEREITALIDSIEKTQLREVLYWRYVEEMTFESIAVTCMDITFRHVLRLHGQALKEFEEKYGALYANI